MEAEILSLLAEHLGCEPSRIKPHDKLADLCDSLEMLELAWAMEDLVGVHITDEQAKVLWRGTVGEIVAWCAGVRK